MKKNKNERYNKFSKSNYIMLNYIMSHSEEDKEKICIDLGIKQQKFSSLLNSIDNNYITIESELNFTSYDPIRKKSKPKLAI